MKKEKSWLIPQKYKKITKEYYEQLYANKLDDLEKMDNVLETRWWCWFSCSVMSDSRSPMDCSLLGSSVHGILQARIPEWVAISFSILETYSPPKVNQEETDNLNRLITRSEIQSVIKKKTYIQKPRTTWLHRGILSNIQRIYTNSSPTLPKDWRGGNTPKDILWSLIHKTNKETTEKEYYTDFPGGPVVKNLPAKTGDVGSILGPGWFHMRQGN